MFDVMTIAIAMEGLADFFIPAWSLCRNRTRKKQSKSKHLSRFRTVP